MKTVARQWHETREQVRRARKRTERKIVLQDRLVRLMTRQLQIENKRK